MIATFLQVAAASSRRRIEAACFGVAGAVTDQVAQLTNVPWLVDCAAVGKALGFRAACVLNDLEALAYGDRRAPA